MDLQRAVAAVGDSFRFRSSRHGSMVPGMISATQLARWAGTTPAQAELPRLVGRLVHAAASPTQISFPAGDPVALPGFDGELHSDDGNAWIPAGFSCWELSCRSDVVAKANEDFEKRSGSTAASVRATRAYPIGTSRSRVVMLSHRFRTSAWLGPSLGSCQSEIGQKRKHRFPEMQGYSRRSPNITCSIPASTIASPSSNNSCSLPTVCDTMFISSATSALK